MKSAIMVGIILVLLASVIGCGGTGAVTSATPPGTPEISTSVPIEHPTTFTTTPDDTSVTTTATEPTPVVTTGTLELHSNAWSADVFIDDVPAGKVGAGEVTINELPPGTHTVKITGSLYSDGSKQCVIEAGKTTVLYEYLASPDNGAPSRNEMITPDSAALYGSLEIFSNAWYADTYVGGEPGGQVGAGEITIDGLLPGTYTVNLTSGTHDPWNKQVTIETGKTTILYANLASEGNGAPTRNEIITPDSAALYGSLEIQTNAWNADTYIGGEPGGQTGIGDVTINGLLPGTYTVKLISSVYFDWTGQVTIQTGQTTVITAEMTSKI